MSELNSLTLASHEFRPKQDCSRCEPPADSSSLAYAQQEAHTNLQESETSPGNPTLQRIFAVNLAHVFLSLITALSYMGKTRVTQTVNIHGWKMLFQPAAFTLSQRSSQKGRTRLYPLLVYNVVCNRPGIWTAFFFFFFFCFLQLCRSHGSDNISPQADTYCLSTHIYDHCRKKHKKDGMNCDCLLLKRNTICPPPFMPQAAEAMKINQLWTLHMYNTF